MVKLKRFIVVALIASLSLAGCMQKTKLQSLEPTASEGKNIILVLVDSLMDEPLHKAVQSGKTPAFRFLLEHGRYYPSMVSSFPTMSVTIESSLLTGTYADSHHVPGLVWYNPKENRLVNYGNGKREMLKLGPGQVLKDSLYSLNNVHLHHKVKTIHEVLAEQGLETASINGLVYRGKTSHRLKIPQAISAVSGLPDEITTWGPKWLSFGGLVEINEKNKNKHLLRKFGLNDRFAADELKFLIRQGKLPFFTMVYLSENDQVVHGEGVVTQKGIWDVDRRLGEMFDAFGSWEKALENTVWVVMSDGGQTLIADSKQALIPLRRLLSSYRVANLGEPVKEKDQLVLAVNERMAYVYALDDQLPLAEAASLLQRDGRIDVIAWKEKDAVLVVSGRHTGTFSFKRHGKFADPYAQTWWMKGNPGLLDIRLGENHRIDYGDYPDVLARLYGALHSHEGRFLVVTAAPGYELVGESSPVHKGGAGHGSLHKEDSLAPIIIAGEESRPRYWRMVDLKDWIVGLSTRR